MIAESSKDKAATSFGAFTTMAGWASVFAPTLGGLFIESNRSQVFLLSSVLFALAATGRAVFLKETLRRSEGSNDSVSKSRISQFKDLKRFLQRVSSNRLLLLLTGAYAIYNLFLTQISFVVPLYSTEVLKLSTTQVGLLFSIFLLVDSQSAFLFGKVADCLGYVRIILISWVGEMLFTMAFVYSAGQLLPFAVFSAWVAFGAMDGPAIQALIGRITKMETRGASIGLFSTLPLLLSVPSRIVTGYLYALSPRLPFFANLSFGILAFVLLLAYVATRDNAPRLASADEIR